MEFVNEYVLAHWPFITFALVAGLTVQVFKAEVWTKRRAEAKGRWQWLFWWGRKTLALHPFVVGALLGLIPGMPTTVPAAESLAGRAVYYAAAGLASCWAFDVIQGLAKKRGIVLTGINNGSGEGGGEVAAGGEGGGSENGGPV
jgi:hypothetical protein